MHLQQFSTIRPVMSDYFVCKQITYTINTIFWHIHVLYINVHQIHYIWCILNIFKYTNKKFLHKFYWIENFLGASVYRQFV